jgi:fatty-acyl-CoA synthase
MRRWDGQTFGKQFEETASRFPGREFIVAGDRRISFRQAKEEVDRLAKGFLALGVRKGDPVAVWLPNVPEFLFAWIAAARIGAPLVPINTRYKTAEFAYILRNCDATTLVVLPEFLNIRYLDMVRSACPELGRSEPGRLSSAAFPRLRNIVCLGGAAHPGTFAYGAVLDAGDRVSETELAEAESRIRPEDDLVVVYTSGTTGNPKGAVHTHWILKNEYRVCNWRSIDENDRFLAFLPWFHVGGGFSQVCPCLITGSCLSSCRPSIRPRRCGSSPGSESRSSTGSRRTSS